MKLIGSKTEREFIEQFKLLDPLLRKSASPLRIVLESLGYNVSKGVILECIPEQVEDCYLVLIDTEQLIQIEIPRDKDMLPICERIDLKAYRINLSKINQIRLAVAQDIVKQKDQT